MREQYTTLNKVQTRLWKGQAISLCHCIHTFLCQCFFIAWKNSGPWSELVLHYGLWCLLDIDLCNSYSDCLLVSGSSPEQSSLSSAFSLCRHYFLWKTVTTWKKWQYCLFCVVSEEIVWNIQARGSAWEEHPGGRTRVNSPVEITCFCLLHIIKSVFTDRLLVNVVNKLKHQPVVWLYKYVQFLLFTFPVLKLFAKALKKYYKLQV